VALRIEVPLPPSLAVSRLIAPPPTPTGYARTLDIMLAVTAPSSAQFVWISNDSSFTNGQLVPVNESGRYDWTLPGDGMRTVYVRFVNDAGASEAVSENVLVDVTKPKLLWARFVGAGLRPSRTLASADAVVPRPLAKRRSWVTIGSTDDLSGVVWMQYGPTQAKPFRWRNLLRTASVRLDKKASFVWLRVADRAGNVSGWLKVPLGR
jgi:hypothetical protein